MDRCHQLLIILKAPDLKPKLAAICDRCRVAGSFNEFALVRNTLEIELATQNEHSLYRNAVRLVRCLRYWVKKISSQSEEQPLRAA